MRKFVFPFLLMLILTLCSCVGTSNTATDETGETSNKDSASSSNKTAEGVLPGGEYTVGEDMPEGSYDFAYLTTMSEDDYWPNDYLYITHSNSEGENETLGGTKYDDRFGGFPFEKASSGALNHYTLKSGDKLSVESSYGDWSYTAKVKNSKVSLDVSNGGNILAGGSYTVGVDFDAGTYTFQYLTTMSEESYWPNDYFYVTYSGSEGKNETLGGTKYDVRSGGYNYQKASQGALCHYTFNDGDSFYVNSDYGDWTY